LIHFYKRISNSLDQTTRQVQGNRLYYFNIITHNVKSHTQPFDILENMDHSDGAFTPSSNPPPC